MNLYSSDYIDWEDRPALNLTYEMTNPWIDAAPTGLLPADGSTLWNTSTPRPSGADSFLLLGLRVRQVMKRAL